MPETGQKSVKSDVSKIASILGQKLTYNETPKKGNPQSVSFSANAQQSPETPRSILVPHARFSSAQES